jgi:hypothetical protein
MWLQHDILWNELTAEEHLEIFADLKGVPRQLRTAVIKDKLESVGLYGVRDKKAGSFSGGMKRRLSVAISCIGEPKIIFMDGSRPTASTSRAQNLNLLTSSSSSSSTSSFARQSPPPAWIPCRVGTSGISFRSSSRTESSSSPPIPCAALRPVAPQRASS